MFTSVAAKKLAFKNADTRKSIHPALEKWKTDVRKEQLESLFTELEIDVNKIVVQETPELDPVAVADMAKSIRDRTWEVKQARTARDRFFAQPPDGQLDDSMPDPEDGERTTEAKILGPKVTEEEESACVLFVTRDTGIHEARRAGKYGSDVVFPVMVSGEVLLSTDRQAVAEAYTAEVMAVRSVTARRDAARAIGQTYSDTDYMQAFTDSNWSGNDVGVSSNIDVMRAAVSVFVTELDGAYKLSILDRNPAGDELFGLVESPVKFDLAGTDLEDLVQVHQAADALANHLGESLNNLPKQFTLQAGTRIAVFVPEALASGEFAKRLNVNFEGWQLELDLQAEPMDRIQPSGWVIGSNSFAATTMPNLPSAVSKNFGPKPPGPTQSANARRVA